MQACHVALIGATGAVGREILQVLEEREFPLRDITLLASARSEGTRLEFRGHHRAVRLLTKEALTGVDIAIFAADVETSRDYASHAVAAGAVVIDCSGAFRHDPQVPLCVPEVNALPPHQGMVATPHSLTVQTVLALAPLHTAASLKRVVIATYQAVSGMGREAMEEFDQQLRDLLNFRAVQTGAFPHQLAFNCVPQCGDFLDNGYTSEEMALVDELRRILAVPDLPITATAVRVPLMHSHGAAVCVETARPLSPDAARDILASAPGLQVEDDTKRLSYPLPVHANGQDAVFVGRIRADQSVPYGLHLWIVADNLRKGAALNVVQVAERLLAS
jgi:aspartate-semialdehyde dehydrogenase